MHFGIITLSRIEVDQGGFYNFQDIGLAKALTQAGHEVTLYRFTKDAEKREQKDGVTMIFRKTFGIGKQTVTGFDFLNKKIERLICFSDNQVSFPALYRWCKKQRILLQPYIGVLNSNSSNQVVRKLTDLLVLRNVKLYRRMKVYGKTPAILDTFKNLGIMDVELVPVCLNKELLHELADIEIKDEIRRQYGYQSDEKILLFIGRMELEKEPLEMITIFKKLCQAHTDYRLVMVGKGALYEEVKHSILKNKLEHLVRLIERVPNQEVWKLYCMSSSFVNLNRHEIYGMSILEAMYYRCPVIAMRAPGPDYLLRQGEIGYLCDSITQLAECIENSIERKSTLQDTRKYVEEQFFWDKAAKIFWQ